MDNETLRKKRTGFYNYIKIKGLRNKDIVSTTSADKSNVSNYMNGRVKPSENFLTTFESCYEILLEDYEKAVIGGTPEHKVVADYTETNVKPKVFPSHMEVSLVTTKARGGYADSYYADEYLKDLPVILVEADKEYKGKYLAFEVDGDSMEPEYYAGDVVICREVKRDLWQYKLHYNDYDFVIAHGTKGIMLKEIIHHNIETGDIVCHSLNNEDGNHNDFVLNLREVSFLYNVVEHRRSGKAKRRYR